MLKKMIRTELSLLLSFRFNMLLKTIALGPTALKCWLKMLIYKFKETTVVRNFSVQLDKPIKMPYAHYVIIKFNQIISDKPVKSQIAMAKKKAPNSRRANPE